MILEILKDLFFVERGYLNANHFAYRGPEPVLIDTGYKGDISKTAAILTDIGIHLERIRLIVATHCHCDHTGANRYLQERSGCQIALHPLGKHFMETRDDWSTWWSYYDQEADFFEATHALDDGEIVRVGPHEFEVVHTPGHSADGIVLYNQKEKVLLSSDTLWQKDMAVMTLAVEGDDALSAMRESLERVASLGAEKVFPGHGPPFADVHGAVSRSLKRLERFSSRPEDIGTDLLKKIVVYTLLMRRGAPEETFLGRLMQTRWFPETADRYFDGQYRLKYDETIRELMKKQVVVCNDGRLDITVKP